MDNEIQIKSHKEIAEDFFNSLKKKSKINIIMHDVPDPDAVGCAMGIQLLAKNYGFESEICYRGEISHPQNKTMINLLNVILTKIPKGEEVDGINVCVDCTPSNSCAKNAAFVIDHHKTSPEAEFCIVEPKYGACSTIVWEIISGTDMETSDSAVYAALLLGIRTDTNDLISEKMTDFDFKAYQDLLYYADKETVQKIMNYPFPRYLYERRLDLHKEGNFYESNGMFVGGIGFIPETQRDVIAILADEYTRMESINTAVIFAITGESKIELSIRSTNVSLDVNQTIKDIFGDYGGGASYKGGAKIPLLFFAGVDDSRKDDLWSIACDHMFKLMHKENWKKKESE